MNAFIYRAVSRRRISGRLSILPARLLSRGLLSHRLLNRRLMPALLLTLLFGTWAPSTEAETTIDESRQAEPNGHVEVINIAGGIVVTGWDADEVTVSGTLGRGVERLDIQADGDNTRIEVIYPKNGRSDSSYLEVRVPRESSLDIRAVSASVEVAEVRGRQRLNSVSGDITAQLFGSDLEAETVSGALDIRGSGLPTVVDLRTVSGNIEIDGVSGELEARTVSGRIEVDADVLDRARLGTTSGRITLEGGLASAGRSDLSTTSGRISVMLDHDADLDVDAQSFSGNIENCFGAESSRNGYSPERSLRFRNGEGNRTVRIRTMSGSINLCAETLSD
jgi:DUF4097 and DUF4098 domain-containing protein YvlB